MNEVKRLHRESISALDSAFLFEREGDQTNAREERERAFRLELAAAELADRLQDSEPSRSILFRSAADLALQINQADDAERLIFRALLGTPPSNIAESLRDLLEQISFTRHLSLRGVELDNQELQLSLAGKGVGFGFAPTPQVVDRLGAITTLLYRTAERQKSRPYREVGPPTNLIRNMAQSYLSVPRAASFAISIRIGRSSQSAFDGLGNAELVVDEMLDCLSFLEERNEDALRARIADSAYLQNFLALAQNIFPDGQEVTTVGFTAVRSGTIRQLAIRHTVTENQEFPLLLQVSPDAAAFDDIETLSEISGQLLFANSLPKKGKIKLRTAEGKTFSVTVPEGMMNDIVKPLWNSWVTVRGKLRGSDMLLMNITRY